MFIKGLSNENDVIRYWSALGCLMLKEKSAPAKEALETATATATPQIRIIAAESLCRTGQTTRALPTLADLLKDKNPKIRLQAANTLDHLGPIAKPLWPAIRIATRDKDHYVKRAARYTDAILSGEEPPGDGE
jgi:N-sulfoglucosamine sulfohydrolase